MPAIAIVAMTLSSLVVQPTQAVPSPTRSKKVVLTVFAASSLSQTFSTIGRQFERTHSGVTVQFSFLASSTLATQLLAGAPADVFASASASDMAKVVTRVPESVLFASNRVILATPRKNKFHINKIVDLNRKGVKWIQCAHTVPCGVAADAALTFESRLTSEPVSLEPKVSSVLAKLLAGEVDAAVIYHTDYVSNKSSLREIRFKNTQAATTHYPIGVVKDGRQLLLARGFIKSVLSANGRKILAEAGFTLVN